MANLRAGMFAFGAANTVIAFAVARLESVGQLVGLVIGEAQRPHASVPAPEKLQLSTVHRRAGARVVGPAPAVRVLRAISISISNLAVQVSRCTGELRQRGRRPSRYRICRHYRSSPPGHAGGSGGGYPGGVIFWPRPGRRAEIRSNQTGDQEIRRSKRNRTGDQETKRQEILLMGSQDVARSATSQFARRGIMRSK